MIGMRQKSLFFDSPRVIRAVDSGARSVLSKVGSYVRTGAKSSIRKAKKPSLPGRPPHSHVGTLKRLIFFGYDVATKSVVIGPMPFRAPAIAPQLLEQGGRTQRRKNARRTIRKVGDGGEIRIGGPASVTTKTGPDGQAVTYCHLYTQAQANRANDLNYMLYGPEVLGGGYLAARPYMGPALEKVKPQIPAMWANSVKA